jgi:cell division septation protein DedD
MLLLALLAACAETPGQPQSLPVPVAVEAADYRAHARTYYAAPGPSDDPWGPYIDEASKRFDVPETWIRAVMHQESGGHEFINGQFVTSLPGAMGLMQLMPPTYDDMRGQYGLGADAYDPHDNIMAGTAYIRQMYDVYGSPGFLAAYNTGPGRLDDFLTRDRALPHETRQYVGIIGPQIAGIYPNSRSQADLMVMNHQIGGTQVAAAQTSSETRSVRMAWARRHDHSSGTDQPVQVAEAPAASPIAAPSYQTAWHPVPPQSRTPRFHLIEPAMATSVPTSRGSTAGMPHDPAPRDWAPRDWAIQVGAFGTAGQASEAAGSARSRVRVLLPDARTEVAGIRSAKGARIYRARLTGLSRDDAMQACQKLSRGRSECMIVSPDA